MGGVAGGGVTSGLAVQRRQESFMMVLSRLTTAKPRSVLALSWVLYYSASHLFFTT